MRLVHEHLLVRQGGLQALQALQGEADSRDTRREGSQDSLTDHTLALMKVVPYRKGEGSRMGREDSRDTRQGPGLGRVEVRLRGALRELMLQVLLVLVQQLEACCSR